MEERRDVLTKRQKVMEKIKVKPNGLRGEQASLSSLCAAWIMTVWSSGDGLMRGGALGIVWSSGPVFESSLWNPD